MLSRSAVLINFNKPMQLALVDEKQAEQCCALDVEEN